MLIFWDFLGLIGAHFMADFVAQTHWQASNKSKSNAALSRHVLAYTAVLGGFSFALLAHPLRMLPWMAFVATNGVLHFVTDYFTSRWSSRLWAKQDWHNFFVVIGLDQLIHYMTLALTLWFFFSEHP